VFNKEKRQEKRERRDAVKATLDEKIKPRPTFAQQQAKAEVREQREAVAAEREGKVTEQLKSVLTRNDPGGVVQLGSDLLYTQGLSGLQLQIQEQMSIVDKCFTRWLMYAKHDGDFLGMAPTNREVKFGGVSVSFLSDDKVTQEYHCWDMVTLLQQIQAP
jgi:hypothetical protein